jgi:hypothetical protein
MCSKGFFIDGEPFSRSHRSRAFYLISGWVKVLSFLRLKCFHVDEKLVKVKERAVELINLHFAKMKNRRVHAPDALAVAALYIACVENGVPVTQWLIGQLAGRTEVFVRNNYKRLLIELNLELTEHDYVP